MLDITLLNHHWKCNKNLTHLGISRDDHVTLHMWPQTTLNLSEPVTSRLLARAPFLPILDSDWSPWSPCFVSVAVGYPGSKPITIWLGPLERQNNSLCLSHSSNAHLRRFLTSSGRWCHCSPVGTQWDYLTFLWFAQITMNFPNKMYKPGCLFPTKTVWTHLCKWVAKYNCLRFAHYTLNILLFYIV